MDKILFIGNGGHAKACIEVIESQDNYIIDGIITDKYNSDKDNKFQNYNIIGNDIDLEKFSNEYKYAFIGIGQIKSPHIRINLFNKLTNYGFILPNIISSHSLVSNRSQIGNGSIVMHHALINANVNIGNNCIINNKALIEHDTKISDNCHISTGAVLNGSVIIEKNTFIGSNSTIMQGIKIGQDSIVSAGCFVYKDLPDGTILK